MPIWGFLFLHLGNLGLIGILIGLLYTFYSSYFIRRFVKEETTLLKVIKLIGPVFYVIVGMFSSLAYESYFILSPIVIAFLVFSLTFFDKSQFPKISLQISMILLALVYIFFIYDYWDKSKQIIDIPNFKVVVEEKNQEDVKLQLDQYRFLNQGADTFHIKPSGKYTIIEAWNETYVASLRSITMIQPFYEKMSDKFDYYYVYMPIQKNRKIDSIKVFAFDKIKEKERILFDVDIWDKAAINRLPTYLVFDPNGKQVFRQDGFAPELRISIQNKLRKAIQ